MLKFGNVDSVKQGRCGHALFYCLNAELSVTTMYLPFKAKCPDTEVKCSFMASSLGKVLVMVSENLRFSVVLLVNY
jgi:hypothetical protein